MKLLCIGFNYRNCPVGKREAVNYTKEKFERAYHHLKKIDGLGEFCIVATCHRNEIYVKVDNGIEYDLLFEAFDAIHQVPSGSYHDYFYRHQNEEMIDHLFRVASGLDSMVLGEPQISGQVKECFHSALNHESIGIYLNRLFTRAFAVNKIIRMNTGIGSGGISLSYLSVDLAKKIFTSLRKKKILVVGTGAMGRLAAQHFRKNDCEHLFLCNRTRSKAEELALELSCQVISTGELSEKLGEFDIVVASVSSNKDYLFGSEQIATVVKSTPRLYIDLSLPRAINPDIGEIENCFVYNVDDLKQVAESNLKNRENQLEEATQIVIQERDRFLDWVKTLDVQDTIVKLRNKFEEIRKEEVDRIKNKIDGNRDLYEKTIEEVTRRLTNKLLHFPIRELKREVLEHGVLSGKENISRMFDLNGNECNR